jgi:hypothetical protein
MTEASNAASPFFPILVIDKELYKAHLQPLLVQTQTLLIDMSLCQDCVKGSFAAFSRSETEFKIIYYNPGVIHEGTPKGTFEPVHGRTFMNDMMTRR